MPEPTLTTAMKQKMEKGLEEWKTPAGKELTLKHVPQTGMYQLKYKGGGELPPKLKGAYTSRMVATQEVETYLKRLWRKQIEEADKQSRKKRKEKASAQG